MINLTPNYRKTNEDGTEDFMCLSPGCRRWKPVEKESKTKKNWCMMCRGEAPDQRKKRFINLKLKTPHRRQALDKFVVLRGGKTSKKGIVSPPKHVRLQKSKATSHSLRRRRG